MRPFAKLRWTLVIIELLTQKPKIHYNCQTRCSRRWQTSSPVPPPGELDETCVLCIILPIVSICENMTSSAKPEYIALPPEQDRATATTSNMYRKCGEIWTCGSEDMRAERQTDRHTDTATR